MLTLKQANRAVELQQCMDLKHQNVFARALPHDGADLDSQAIVEFEKYALEFGHTDALNFLHEALTPSPLVIALCGESSPLVARLCGI